MVTGSKTIPFRSSNPVLAPSPRAAVGPGPPAAPTTAPSAPAANGRTLGWTPPPPAPPPPPPATATPPPTPRSGPPGPCPWDPRSSPPNPAPASDSLFAFCLLKVTFSRQWHCLRCPSATKGPESPPPPPVPPPRHPPPSPSTVAPPDPPRMLEATTAAAHGRPGELFPGLLASSPLPAAFAPWDVRLGRGLPCLCLPPGKSTSHDTLTSTFCAHRVGPRI